MKNQPLPLISFCEQYPARILTITSHYLVIAVSSAPDLKVIGELAAICQRHIHFVYWPPARLALKSIVPPRDKKQLDGEPKTNNLSHPAPPLARSIPEFAKLLLEHVIQMRASDLHLETLRNGLRIRLRIDGIMQPATQLNKVDGEALLAHYKILSGADSAENRLPQDGQLSITLITESHFFRLSSLPIRDGEKVVLRYLRHSDTSSSLPDLDMTPSMKNEFQQVLKEPQGLILVTGPTGSGKSLTLCHAMQYLNTPERNLCSVEDPIEIVLPGVNQTQLQAKAGLDFQRILAGLLRQDPDVIMIGEIRDTATADIAFKAALTGHLVLSTLHTTSTTETLIRLRQMQLPNYLIGAALKLVVAQRLVRKLCPLCRQPGQPLGLDCEQSSIPVMHWLPQGCSGCLAGYFQRQAIFEIMVITDELRTAIYREAPLDTLQAIALSQQVQPLFEAGLQLVRQGLTSFAELIRVTGNQNVRIKTV